MGEATVMEDGEEAADPPGQIRRELEWRTDNDRMLF
jgi:hypothetical protein